MNRSIVYAGELPRLEDFMGSEKATLYALGYLSQSVLGSPTAVQGLVCAPTSPASLQVTVGTGSIYETETVDATAYGALGTDVNTITKQGLLTSPQTLTITPPVTSGYSQVYLVQTNYNDVDTNAIVLNYYNAANPAQPLSGPNNSATQQFTIRGGQCIVSLKVGTAATTGTQVAPAADSGYTPLYSITVANGQTQITSASISVYPGAPFIPLTLPQVPPAIQAQVGNYALDTGTANALAITLPFGTTLTAGMPIRIKKGASANTGAMTVTINSGSPLSVIWAEGSAFAAADWPANAVGQGVYDGTAVRMLGPVGPTIFNRSGTTITNGIGPYYGTDTGVADAIQVSNLAPAITAYAAGQLYLINVARTNLTTTPKIQIGALGQLTITRADGTPCHANDIQIGADVLLACMGSSVQLVGVYTNFLPSSNITQFLTSTTWVVPTGVFAVKRVRVWGAGGGGGGTPGGGGSSCGGGGAGYAEGYFIPVTPGASITVTVGAGGAGGVGNAYGTAGGNSSFGAATPIVGNGGGGGSPGSTNVVGAGGTASGAQLTVSGSNSGLSFAVGAQNGCGFGGGSPFGGGVAALGLNNNGAAGLFPGGGANGGSSASSTATGGTGANGMILIEY